MSLNKQIQTADELYDALNNFTGKIHTLMMININFTELKLDENSYFKYEDVSVLSFHKCTIDETCILFKKLNYRWLLFTASTITDLSILFHPQLATLKIYPESIIHNISSFSMVPNLKQIDIETVNIPNLPQDINTLQSLTSLYLYRCNITSLSQSICELKEIKNLVISGNPITHLDDDFFKNMKNLTNLDISGTDILKHSNIPSSIILAFGNKKGCSFYTDIDWSKHEITPQNMYNFIIMCQLLHNNPTIQIAKKLDDEHDKKYKQKISKLYQHMYNLCCIMSQQKLSSLVHFFHSPRFDCYLFLPIVNACVQLYLQNE